MLAEDISAETFEEVVHSQWQARDIRTPAPQAAAALSAIASQRECVDGLYGVELPHLNFTSQWLTGKAGRPGAILIHAPAEVAPAPRRLSELNRALHQHDSGRMALITGGAAIFHVERTLGDGERVIIDCPVTTGDLLCWPSWTPHTFDACEGFSLISAMAQFVSPAEDGFTFPLFDAQTVHHRRVAFDDFRRRRTP